MSAIKLSANDKTVSSSAPLPVAVFPASSTSGWTDRSGTITTGGTAQAVCAANTSRRYLLVVNNTDTDMWINDTATAVADSPSIKLPANGGFFEPLVPPLGAISIICATTGKKFTAKEA